MAEQTHTDDVLSSSAVNDNEKADENRKLEAQDSYQNRSTFSEDICGLNYENSTTFLDPLVNNASNPPTSRLDPELSERHSIITKSSDRQRILNLPDLSELATLNRASDEVGNKTDDAFEVARSLESQQAPNENTNQNADQREDAAHSGGTFKENPTGLKIYKRRKIRDDVLVKTNRVFRQRYHLQTKFRERKIPGNILSHVSEFQRPPFKNSSGKNWYVDQITKQVQKILMFEKRKRRPRSRWTKRKKNI